MHCWDILAVLRKQCIQNLLSNQGRSLNPITIKTLTKHSSYGLTDVKNCVLLLGISVIPYSRKVALWDC
jgi:hypothetical protein